MQLLCGSRQTDRCRPQDTENRQHRSHTNDNLAGGHAGVLSYQWHNSVHSCSASKLSKMSATTFIGSGIHTAGVSSPFLHWDLDSGKIHGRPADRKACGDPCMHDLSSPEFSKKASVAYITPPSSKLYIS